MGYKKIESQEEYDLMLIQFKARLNEFSKPFRMLKEPIKFYEDYISLFEWAEGIGLFSKEYCTQQKQRLIDGFNNADLKERFKKALRRRGIIK